ncbi:MAG: hypothetical protein AAB281_00020, partial [Actinomycetota bacterium]
MNNGSKKKYKAIALLSGGLDSRLAVKMMLDQGVEVEAINFMTVFCTCTAKGSCKSEAKKAAEEYGIPMKTLNVTEGLMAAVKNPKHGYGRGLNPCLDCRINMFRRAGEYMREVGADFIVTGEVLGERPMSQRPDAIRIIEEESGLSGLVVRPLSAHLFEPTIPEQKGWVDRSRLMAIRGRSRKPQMQLADEIGVNDYPCPSGGCLLTDKNFSNRLKSLMDKSKSEGSDPPLADIRSLRMGRIFFSSEDRRILIPRNEDETRRVANIAREGDTLMEAAELTGPTTLIRGNGGGATLREAAALTARYGQGRDRDQVSVRCWVVGKNTNSEESTGGKNADGNSAVVNN